jgi:ABC-type multidrug transport system ATPase subunit/ABC-type multidrug transport system permease subunit
MQDDRLIGLLTVRESLAFSAELRLGTRCPADVRKARVAALLSDLGLYEVQNSLVGTPFKRGISGGEKKRLAVAMELITDPAILFLDEPTTGLDAFNSYVVMDRLKRVASEQQRTIVCCVHQPRSTIWDLFDRLILLSRGQIMFSGYARDAVAHFGALGFEPRTSYVNPADFVIDVCVMTEKRELFALRAQAPAGDVEAGADEYSQALLTRNREQQRQHEDTVNKDLESGAAVKILVPRKISELADAARTYFVKHIEPSTAAARSSGASGVGSVNPAQPAFVLPSGATYGATFFKQFRELSRRTVTVTKRNPFATYVALGQALFMAILLGLTYRDMGLSQNTIQDRLGIMFFITVNQAFSQFGSLATFMEEREVFCRERESQYYRTSAYFLARSIVDVPMLFVFPLVFCAVVYFMVHLQEAADKFVVFFLAAACVGNVAASMFLAIGAVTPNMRIAQLIAPIVLVLFLLYSGFYLNINSIPVYFSWLSRVSFFRYAYEVMVSNEFSGLEFTCAGNQTQCYVNGTSHACICIILAIVIDQHAVITLQSFPSQTL